MTNENNRTRDLIILTDEEVAGYNEVMRQVFPKVQKGAGSLAVESARMSTEPEELVTGMGLLPRDMEPLPERPQDVDHLRLMGYNLGSYQRQ
jgi:hypothetical protein